MDPTTDQLLLAVIAVVSPILVALFTKVSMSAKTKTTVAMIVSFVIAAGYLFFSGSITDWTEIAVVFPAVFGIQQIVFKLLLTNVSKEVEKKAGLTDKPVEIYSDTPAKG